MFWNQHSLVLQPRPRGCHSITHEIKTAVSKIGTVQIGMLHIFCQHTSASLSLNEDADPDVRRDMNMALDTLCPETLPYVHSSEGPDDMPAHVKTALMGSSLTIPITDGQLALGTWQGVYLNEHRNHGGARRLLLTLWGLLNEPAG